MERLEHSHGFQEKLKALHEVGMELSGSVDIDDLCRRSIELGRSKLGFDRLGLFLIEGTSNTVVGTFGVDTQGHLRDERELRWDFSNDPRFVEVLRCKDRVAVWEDTPLLDNWQEVGRGWNIMAALWIGEQAIGWLAADNLISRKPLTPYDSELLSLYSTTIGHLITRKRAEEDLAQLKHAIEIMQLGVTITDLDGRIVYTNQAEAAMHGYQVEELIGQHSRMLAPAELRMPVVLREIERWNGLVRESVNIRKDGTTFPVRLMSEIVKGGDGRPCAIITSCEDITERKALEAEREQYRNHLEELVKERTAELTATNMQLHQEIVERKRAQEESMRAKEAALEAKNAALEAKNAAEAAQRIAETANRAKSEFLANMSHELRTPLNAILGFSQILAHEQAFDAEYREYIETINRNGEHLLTLINQVLDLSKIEAERMMFNEEEFDLYLFLDGLEDIFALRAEAKHLHLYFERAPNVPQYVRTDAVKLRQILMNLLNNAIKFTEKGKVELRVANSELRIDQSEIRNLKFEIQDTGPGIAHEELDGVFEAFVQADVGRRSGQGTGLGLTISQRFVQLLGGVIEVKSVPGQGATFTFNIPVHLTDPLAVVAQHANKPQRVLGLEPGQSSYRILIVDDNADSRRLLVKFLTLPGFEVREAKNGQEGIDMWEVWEPHAILMDMRMPVMDGYEATRMIRKLETGNWKLETYHSKSQVASRKCRTTIIALTASTLAGERQEILDAGCDDFLGKPLHESDLFEMLQKHLGVRYVYETLEEYTENDGEPHNTKPLMLIEALAMLPDELLEELGLASVRLNAQRVDKIIKTIAEHHTVLAHALAKHAERFQYDQIFSYIERAQELKKRERVI